MVQKQKSKPANIKDNMNSKITPQSPYATFPLSRYASLLGSQTLGLGFTLGMLPRTIVLQNELAKLFSTQDDMSKSSQDHPQHPFLEPLTESPARTLFWVCVGSFILIAWNAGSLRAWNAATKGEQEGSPSAQDSKKLSESEKTLFGTTIKTPPTPAKLLALKDALAATTFAFPVLLGLIMLFGAPLRSHLISTSFLALLMAVLTVWTPAFTFGLPGFSSTLVDQERRQRWIDTFVEFSVRSPVDRAVVFPALGAIIGCWLGALPMPLDWDRPWQAWPLTSAYMAVVGHVVGAGTSLAVSVAQFLLIEAELEKRSEQ
ncbi:GPI biosynthesis family Pig-F protein [Ceratobasidium sp. AG-Ba]|nr:GPI biosynthesis family Pig-F protein [Ceratobasidium sp. AG-Ba]QRW13483.1 GPI biosynthesis family Pig-F protein [Ceratobasidium sp. AG-Ba]